MTNYIMSKRGILIVALLMLVLPASSLASFSIWNDDYTDLNFDTYNWYASSWHQEDEETRTFYVTGQGKLNSDTIFLRIASDNISSAVDSTISCYDISKNNFNVSLNPVYITNPRYKLYAIPFGQYETFYTDRNNISSYMAYCSLETFSDDGNNLTVILYGSPKDKYLPSFYKSPSQPLEDIVYSVKDIIDASFDIFDLMLIVTIMMGLGFLMVFSWKTLVYMVNSIKRND